MVRLQHTHNDISQAERQELEMLREAVRRHAATRREYILPIRVPHLRLGICADAHIGSRFERLDALHTFFDYCEKEKIDRMIIVGDILDGWRVYSGHEFDLYAHGLERQIGILEKEFGKKKYKFAVDFICGNHDLSFRKLCGVNVGTEISGATHWRHLGDEYASLIILPSKGLRIKIDVSHPGSTGSAYALSYRPQKIIDALTGGAKPDMLVIGHYHKAEYLPMYRNISAIQAGCFQAQTPYMESKGIAAHVGGWIVEYSCGRSTNISSARFVSFYEQDCKWTR